MDNTIFFTNRHRILETLRVNLQGILKGRGNNLALLGPRRIGKTMVLRKFLEGILQEEGVLPVYIHMEGMIASPVFFALKYSASIINAYAMKIGIAMSDEALLDPVFLASEAQKLKNSAIQRVSKITLEEWARTAQNEARLFQEAFELSENLAQEEALRVIVILDEFQELKRLDGFPQIRDSLGLMRSITERQIKTSYIVSGSLISLMEMMFKEGGQPFFAQFQIERIGSFTKEDSVELATKIFHWEEVGFTDKVLDNVFQLTMGHPFYVTVISERAAALSRRLGKKIDRSTVQRAFIEEVLNPDGRIYLISDYIYRTSLAKVKGGLTLVTTLQALAHEDGLTMSEIARRIRKKTGEVNIYLKSLLESDLIIKGEDRYFFRDPVLKYWLAQVALGKDTELTLRPVVLNDLIQELEERFHRASSQLGIAVESQIREMMSKFKGQRVAGGLLGTNRTIVLPVFKEIKEYSSRNGNVQVDALAKNKETWAVEIKWSNRRSNKADMARFYQSTSSLADRHWFISRSGFADAAVAFAREHDVYISSLPDLQKLAKIVKYRLQ
ncbi:MAG: ATP-binding protein [Deltaproteobacteria bacterium]|nr:ATP-binding protein [Deltaproteobacteria bacterium]